MFDNKMWGYLIIAKALIWQQLALTNNNHSNRFCFDSLGVVSKFCLERKNKFSVKYNFNVTNTLKVNSYFRVIFLKVKRYLATIAMHS